MHTLTCVWRSEDNWQKWVLSTMCVPGINSMAKFVSKHPYSEPALLALDDCFLCACIKSGIMRMSLTHATRSH